MSSPSSHSNNFYFGKKFRLKCPSRCSLNQNSHNVKGAKELLALIHLEIQNQFFSGIASIKTFFQSLSGQTFNLLRKFCFKKQWFDSLSRNLVLFKKRTKGCFFWRFYFVLTNGSQQPLTNVRAFFSEETLVFWKLHIYEFFRGLEATTNRFESFFRP